MKTRHYRCRTVRRLLPLHVGGDLQARQTVAVDEHLHSCLSCFREFRELATMRGRLGVLAEEPLPAGILDRFTEEVMARIEIGESGPAARLPGRSSPRVVWTRVAAAAAVLLLAGTAFWNREEEAGPPLVVDGSPVVGSRVYTAQPDQLALPRPIVGDRGMPGSWVSTTPVMPAVFDVNGDPPLMGVMPPGAWNAPLLPDPNRQLRPRQR